MAAGDRLLDASGNVILDASGNVMLSDGAGDACCCGSFAVYRQAVRCCDNSNSGLWFGQDPANGNHIIVNGVSTATPYYFTYSGVSYTVPSCAFCGDSSSHSTLPDGSYTTASGCPAAICEYCDPCTGAPTTTTITIGDNWAWCDADCWLASPDNEFSHKAYGSAAGMSWSFPSGLDQQINCGFAGNTDAGSGVGSQICPSGTIYDNLVINCALFASSGSPGNTRTLRLVITVDGPYSGDGHNYGATIFSGFVSFGVTGDSCFGTATLTSNDLAPCPSPGDHFSAPQPASSSTATVTFS